MGSLRTAVQMLRDGATTRAARGELDLLLEGEVTPAAVRSLAAKFLRMGHEAGEADRDALIELAERLPPGDEA